MTDTNQIHKSAEMDMNRKLETPKPCPHCGKLIEYAGFVTCNNSHCQEAEFYANGQRNRERRGRKTRPA